MLDTSKSPSRAPPPFDHASADVILRSADNVDFRVFKLFLSLASPFFETLFELPQSNKETKADVEVQDGLPVITVTEDSKTLDSLLRFCYPCTLADDPSLEKFKDIADVLEAAQKYSLNAIERRVCKTLTNPKVLAGDSLRCFAVTRRARLREECLLAAKYSLREPLVPTWFEEIVLITSTDLLSLIAYHQKCGTVVQSLRNDFSWIESHYRQWNEVHWMIGRRSRESTSDLPVKRKDALFGVGPSQWWLDFMDSTFMALRNKPCAETVQSNVEEAIRKVRGSNCKSCCLVAPTGMQLFSMHLTRKVEELIATVSSLSLMH
ncbi:hypothetical protein ID866_10990 [Astraeus odoratus]|nr:hypothetical protein ID866_10990 [Astraeus odoratus]